MSAVSRTEAQQRVDDIRVFERELDRLVREQVLELSAAQRSALAAHHQQLLAGYTQAFDVDRDRHARQLSLGMRIASFLGALALAASVFFLFYQFWGLLDTAVQVAVLILAAVGTFVGTLVVQRRDGGFRAALRAVGAGRERDRRSQGPMNAHRTGADTEKCA